MRAVGLHADVVVATSRAYQTTCTLVRSGGEAFCIDSPVFPDELEILPALAEQAGFSVVGLLATHADWDHLLGRYAFPEAPLGLRGDDRGAAGQRAGRRAARAARVRRGALRRAPAAAVAAERAARCRCRASCEVGDARARAAPGRRAHRGRHGDLGPVGARARLRRLPVAGRDPDARPRAGRRARTSRRSRGSSRSSSRPSTSCPATARRSTATRAAAILREDRAYLEALLEHGEAAKLPLARRTAAQRKHPRRERGAPAQGPDPVHGFDPQLAAAIFEARAGERLAADPPPLGRRRPETLADAASITADGLGARGGARAPARRAAAGHHGDRPSALPRVHPERPHARGRARRPADQRVRGLRRLVARGRRRRPRRERGAALARRRSPGFPRPRAAASCQGGTNGNLSALHAARERARHGGGTATRVACGEEVHSSVRSMLRMMDAGALEVPGDRLTGEALRAALDGGRRRVRGRRHRPARRTSGRSTTSPASPRSAASAGCGCTSTAPTGSRRCARRACATALRRDRARRLVHRRPAQVAVRAVRLVRARLPRAGATAAPRTASTRRYLESLYADDDGVQPVRLRRAPHAPAARRCRSGSRSPSTAPTRSREAVERTLALTREAADGDPRATRARAARRARAVRARVPPPRLGGRRLRPLGGRRCGVRHGVRAADDGRRRDRRPARDRQSATTLDDIRRSSGSCSNRKSTDRGLSVPEAGSSLPIKFWAVWAILSHMNNPPVNKQRADALRQILATPARPACAPA